MGGSHVSSRDAERTTLATALQRYEREGLTGDVDNADKDRTRIAVILRDPIAKKTLAQLRKTDVAAFRDRLLEAGFLRKVDNKIKKIGKDPGDKGTEERLGRLASRPSRSRVAT